MSLLYHKETYKIFLLKVALIFTSGFVFAAERTVEPEVSFGSVYNDNMTANDSGDEAYGLSSTVSSNFSYKTETKGAELFLSNKSSYHNRHDFDSDDQILRLSFNNLHETSKLYMGIGYVRNTSRTSEIENTGKIGNVRHESLSVSPGYEIRLSERFSLSNEFSAGFSEYEENDNGLIGYRNFTLSSSLVYEYSDVLSLSVTPTFKSFTSGDQYSSAADVIAREVISLQYQNESKAIGFTFGGTYKHADRLTSSFRIGRTKRVANYKLSSASKSACVTNGVRLLSNFFVLHPICDEADRDSVITDLNYYLSWRMEKSSLSARVSVEFLPNSTGDFSRSEKLNLGFNRKISEKLFFNTNLVVSEREVFYRENGVNNKGGLRLYDLILGMNYKITDKLSVGGYTNYYVIDESRRENTRSRNQVSFSISYKPAKIFW